jgi:hypothetical protein
LADANAPLEKLQLDTSWQAQAWLDSQKVRLNGWLNQQEQALGQKAHGLGDSLVNMLLAWVQQQLHGLVNQVFGGR